MCTRIHTQSRVRTHLWTHTIKSTTHISFTRAGFREGVAQTGVPRQSDAHVPAPADPGCWAVGQPSGEAKLAVREAPHHLRGHKTVRLRTQDQEPSADELRYVCVLICAFYLTCVCACHYPCTTYCCSDLLHVQDFRRHERAPQRLVRPWHQPDWELAPVLDRWCRRQELQQEQRGSCCTIRTQSHTLIFNHIVYMCIHYIGSQHTVL